MTWRELLKELDKMLPERLDEEAQVLLPHPDETRAQALLDVVSFGEVGYLLGESGTSRSSYDNKHHPEDYVILADHNMFAEDGSIGFDLLTGERIFPNK